MLVFIVFLIFVVIYIIISSIRESYQNISETDPSCQEITMQNSINENTQNIATIQSQITSILSNIQDMSNNMVSMQDEVNGMSSQQAQLVSGAQPATVSGLDDASGN